MLERDTCNVQAVNIACAVRAVVAEIETRAAPRIENSNILLMELARGDRIRDLPHRHEPPVLLLQLIEQFEILRVHARELTSSACDNAGSIRLCGRDLLRFAHAPSTPSRN